MRLTHLSLFSGIGGLDIAAEKAGFETVGQCEWADYPTKVLEKHWPDVPRWRDIRTLTGEDFYAKTGLRTVDVISGGFPCQPFSLAGQRRGTEDDRYLWPQMLRVIEELRPTWVIGENVAGLVSMVKSRKALRVEGRAVNLFEDAYHYEATWIRQDDMLLVELIGDLERLGYSVQAFVIPACAVGAAHRRDRLALIANSNEIRRDVRRPGGQGVQRTDAPFYETDSGGKDVAHASKQRERGLSVQPRGSQQTDSYTFGSGEGAVGGNPDCKHAEEERGIRGRENAEPAGNGEDVADTEGKRLQGERPAGEQVPGARCQKGEPERLRPNGDTASTGFSDGPNQPLGGSEPQPQPERPDRRAAQPGMGGVVDGIPSWMDGYWLEEPDIPRVVNRMEYADKHPIGHRVDQLKALGNAVYWRQFYPIFAGIYHLEEGQP